MQDDREGERRHITAREFALIFTLLLNFAALVWGASKLTNTVAILTSTVDKLEAATQNLVADLVQIKIDYNARLRVLESREGR